MRRLGLLAATALAIAAAALAPSLASAAGGVTVTPAGIDFHAVPSGTVSQPATVQNTTAAPVTLTAITAGTGPGAGGTFAVDASGCLLGSPTRVLAAGASCVVSVSFTVTSGGPASGHLDVNTDSAGLSGIPLAANGAPLGGGGGGGAPLNARPHRSRSSARASAR